MMPYANRLAVAALLVLAGCGTKSRDTYLLPLDQAYPRLAALQPVNLNGQVFAEHVPNKSVSWRVVQPGRADFKCTASLTAAGENTDVLLECAELGHGIFENNPPRGRREALVQQGGMEIVAENIASTLQYRPYDPRRVSDKVLRFVADNPAAALGNLATLHDRANAAMDKAAAESAKYEPTDAEIERRIKREQQRRADDLQAAAQQSRDSVRQSARGCRPGSSC